MNTRYVNYVLAPFMLFGLVACGGGGATSNAPLGAVTAVTPADKSADAQCYDFDSHKVVACDSPGTVVANAAQDGVAGADANAASSNAATAGSEKAAFWFPIHKIYYCSYVDEVQLALGRTTDTTGTVTVEIRQSYNYQADTILASATIDASRIPPSGGFQSFTFNSPACVISGIGQTYRIAVSVSHPPAGTDAVYWFANADGKNLYVPGSGYINGWPLPMSWDNVGWAFAGDDYAFRVFLSGVADQGQWDFSGFRAAVYPVDPNACCASGYSYQEFVPGYH